MLIRNTEEKMRLRKEEGPQGCRGLEGREQGKSREATAVAGVEDSEMGDLQGSG